MRPEWPDYFLGIAKAVSARADCTRARHGAVVVRRDNTIASTGYNGHWAGGPSCLQGQCPRGRLTASECPSLSSYDTGPPEHRCESQHAESNALAFANENTAGYTLYVTGEPCAGCVRTARAHRISRVVWPSGELVL